MRADALQTMHPKRSAPGQPTQQVLKLETPISALTKPPALTCTAQVCPPSAPHANTRMLQPASLLGPTSKQLCMPA
jgi:hypothetical protein